MTLDELSKKYANFSSPKCQIMINGEDIAQKYSISASTVTVEEAIGIAPKFGFTIDDPQLVLASSTIFELDKIVQIKMGYANALEPVIIGQIVAVKTDFLSDRPPQISVVGENKNLTFAAAGANNHPAMELVYGSTLLSAAFDLTSKNLADAMTLGKTPSLKRHPQMVAVTHCNAQCVGIPEIKSRTRVGLVGLGSKYSRQYLIERSVHSFSGSLGYRVTFDAKLEA